MAVPFSNTTVRVPHGFANLLEGLSREVLRRQPEDIPTFAAQYFAELLQKREESGSDPEKCCASMEQSFSKDDTASDAVNQETCSPVEETSSSENEGTVSQKDSCENIEDIITQPTQNSSPSPETLDIFNDIVEPPDSQANNELNESEEESGETDSELSYRGTADVDMRAERLKNTETDEEEMFENIQESDSVDEAAEKDLDPVTLISYHGLADIDVCAEELQSTSQEEKHTEGSGDVTVTDACFIPPSESPDPVLVEQGVLDSRDEFTRSETETSLYVDQDVDKEINDISYNEKTLASPVNEDKLEENCDLSENVSEMTNTLSDDTGPEIHHVDQLHLNEEAESTSVSEVKTLDETYTDEMPPGVEIQQANDILAAEATSESSFILEKVSLEDRSHNNSPGLENLVNVGSEVQEENNNQESVTDLTAATDERDSQIDIQEDEIYDDKQGDPQDIPEMSPVGDMEGFVDSILNPTGIPSEDMNKDDARTSQQDEIEAEDISEVDEGNNSLNAPEAQEDNLFYSTFTHHSKSTLSVPTSDETERDMKVNYKLSATPSQEHTEEPEPAADYKESEQLEEKVHEPIVESENKDLDQQEESSQPQEEEDIMDIPLDDPEANKAAAKIQAGFRGHMTRKKLKPGDKPGEEVSSTGETLNGSQGDAAGGSEGVETDETSVPEQ